jgi:hypothetical protein
MRYWVSTQKLPIEGPRAQQGYSSEPSPMGSGFGVLTMIRDSSVGGNFALQAVSDKVKTKGAKGRKEKKTLHQSCRDCIYNHGLISHNVTASAVHRLLHEIMEHIDEA